MIPEFRSSCKLSDDKLYATVSYTFRNLDEAIAFESMVNSILQGMKNLDFAARDTESWSDEEKKWN